MSELTIAERLNLLKEKNNFNAANNIKVSKIPTRKFISKIDNDLNDNMKVNDSFNTSAKKLKKDKNSPTVMRSDKQVSVLRKDPIFTSAIKFQDPRFSSISNNKVDYAKFYKNYDFINDIQNDEIKALDNEIKKTKNPEDKLKLKSELMIQRQQILERQRAVNIQKRLQQTYNEERKKIKEGKKPFFLKKSAIKEIEIEERYKELVKDGKLNNFLAKKRKRNASKDHKRVPLRRPFQTIE